MTAGLPNAGLSSLMTCAASLLLFFTCALLQFSKQVPKIVDLMQMFGTVKSCYALHHAAVHSAWIHGSFFYDEVLAGVLF